MSEPCLPSANGRRCETHGGLPLYPRGKCFEGLRAAADPDGASEETPGPPRVSNGTIHDPKDGAVLVSVHYFKASGKWYTEDRNAEWLPDASDYTGWAPFASVVRIKNMFAVCLETPLGYPKFYRPPSEEDAEEETRL